MNENKISFSWNCLLNIFKFKMFQILTPISQNDGKKKKVQQYMLAKFSRDSVEFGEILQWFTAQLVNFEM